MDQREPDPSGLDLLDVVELLLHVAAVSATLRVAPGHHDAIRPDRGKCRFVGLDGLHIPQLLPNAVTVAKPPTRYGSISQDGGRGLKRGGNLGCCSRT